MCDKENIKRGKGFYVTSQLKSVVIKRYNDLNKVVPKMKKQDVINDIRSLTGISRRTIYNILKNGCNSPKKKIRYLNLEMILKIVILAKLMI